MTAFSSHRLCTCKHVALGWMKRTNNLPLQTYIPFPCRQRNSDLLQTTNFDMPSWYSTRPVEEGIQKVRRSLSSTTRRPRRTATPRIQQNLSNTPPPRQPTADPALLAASQLFWAQQWVPQDNPTHPTTISTRANRKLKTLWLTAVAVFSKKHSQPRLGGSPPRDLHPEAP